MASQIVQIWIYTITSVLLVSFIALIGLFTLALKKDHLNKMLSFLVAFSAGSLLGGAFLHLMPEALEGISDKITVSVLIMLGIVIFFILEKVVHWRHCHIPTSHDHPHPYAYTNLIGDLMHNFLDGIVIASAYFVSIPLGISTTIAVAIHEIPQEIGDFGILIHGGFKAKQALLINFLTALTALAGAIIILTIGAGAENFTKYMLPITAGGFIYIAASDLIPELQKEVKASKSFIQVIAIILGIAIMWGLMFLG